MSREHLKSLWERRKDSDEDCMLFLERLAEIMDSGRRIPRNVGPEIASVLREARSHMESNNPTNEGNYPKVEKALLEGLGIRRRKKRDSVLEKIDLSDLRRAKSDQDLAESIGMDRTTVNKALKQFGGLRGAKKKIREAKKIIQAFHQLSESLEQTTPRPHVTGGDIEKAFPNRIPRDIRPEHIERLLDVTRNRQAEEQAAVALKRAQSITQKDD